MRRCSCTAWTARARAKPAPVERLPEDDRRRESTDLSDLKNKAKTLDDLSTLIRSSRMTPEEFISWLEVMRLSHQDPVMGAEMVNPY